MRTAFIAALMAASAPTVAQVTPRTTAPSHGYVFTPEDEKILGGMFLEADADRNGRITKPEMSAYGARHRMGVIVREKVWKQMDTDRNGTIDRAEFMESARAFKTRKDGL